MSQIGTLTTGAGVVTVIAGQAQCEQYILLGDVDTANALQGLTVEIDGTPFINIQTAALINAFAKWQMELTASTVGVMLKIATGSIRRNTTYRFTNAGATVPVIFGFSEAKDGIPLIATTKSINATSYEDFERFSALFIQTPANVGNIEIVFADGSRSTLTAVEVDGLFSLKNQSEADGRLGGVSVIDNSDQSIKSVRINANTAVNILVAKLPDEAYQVLTGGQ